MTAAWSSGLRAADVAEDAIHFELFGAAAAGEGESHLLHIDGRTEPVPYLGEPTVLHALDTHGVAVDSECRAGHCGACRLRLLAGVVDEALPPRVPLHAGEVLACCIRPRSDLRLTYSTRTPHRS